MSIFDDSAYLMIPYLMIPHITIYVSCYHSVPVQEIVCTLHVCSEADRKGVEVGMVDGCVARHTFMRESSCQMTVCFFINHNHDVSQTLPYCS